MKAVAITVVTTRDRYGLLLEKKFEKNPNVSVAFVSPPGFQGFSADPKGFDNRQLSDENPDLPSQPY